MKTEEIKNDCREIAPKVATKWDFAIDRLTGKGHVVQKKTAEYIFFCDGTVAEVEALEYQYYLNPEHEYRFANKAASKEPESA